MFMNVTKELEQSIKKLKESMDVFESANVKLPCYETSEDLWLENLYNSKLVTELSMYMPTFNRDRYVFFCVGTDRNTGDSIGPFIGTELEKLGFNVIGTIDRPVHALNMVDRMNEIPKFKRVVAIDASVSASGIPIGSVNLVKGGLSPGSGVQLDLGDVGDFSIHCNVSALYATKKRTNEMLSNMRLSQILKMRDYVVESIKNHFDTV